MQILRLVQILHKPASCIMQLLSASIAGQNRKESSFPYGVQLIAMAFYSGILLAQQIFRKRSMEVMTIDDLKWFKVKQEEDS